MQKKNKILLICGSIQEHSFSRKVVETLFENYSNENTELKIVDFRSLDLPFFDGSQEARSKAEVFVDLVEQSNSLFIVSPEYHNSFPGVLKNAFDFVSSKNIKGKPVSLVATSGGGKGGINCLNAMRIFLRGLYALPLSDQLVINKCEEIDGAVVDKLVTMTDELVLYSEFNEFKTEKTLLNIK